MNRDTIIHTWLNRWRNLRAWGRTLDELTIDLIPVEHRSRLGTCWPTQQRVRLYYQPKIIDVLKTGLHEMAHAAVPASEGHGIAWQNMYAAATAEVTGIAVVAAADSYQIVDDACADALRLWWKRSGNAFAVALLTRAFPKTTSEEV